MHIHLHCSSAKGLAFVGAHIFLSGTISALAGAAPLLVVVNYERARTVAVQPAPEHANPCPRHDCRTARKSGPLVPGNISRRRDYANW